MNRRPAKTLVWGGAILLNRRAPVAQLDRVLASGARGRWFESSRAYQSSFLVVFRPPDSRLLDFLRVYDPSICSLALGLRTLVLEEAPEAPEMIYDAYNAVAFGFSFTGRLKEAFIHIAVYAKHVNLGFNYGATLADPRGVLVGTGKQVRHIKIGSQADLERPYLREYVRAAIEQAGDVQSPAAGVPTTQVRGNYPVKRRPAKSAGR
jgi:hypothetical protein